MGSTQVKKGNGFLDLEAFERPSYRRIGLINGFLIGLALALGAWVGEAISLAQLPIQMPGPSLIIGSLLLIIICALAGWLTSRWPRLVSIAI